MSVAVGIECDGGVWLAADSAISEGPLIDVSGGKLIKRAGYAIASVGYARAEQVLTHYLDLPGPASDEHVMNWAVTLLVPALQSLAEEYEPWPDSSSKDDDGGWALLVGACGVVFSVGSDYAVHRSQRGYQAIGSGAHIALGALYATHPLDARNRCTVAVKAAASWCSGVLEPCEMQWVPA